MLQKLFLSSLFLLSFCVFGQKKDKDYYAEKAFELLKKGLFTQTSEEFRIYIDSGLVEYSDYHRLWREKATSYFKAGLYAPAIECMNKAVSLDTIAWLGYRGFMKGLFMKDYENGLKDFLAIEKKRAIYGDYGS